MNRQQKSTCQSITVCIEQAVNTIKQAAEANEDQSLYKIRNLDLIAKEFKYHERCHKDYTWKGKLSTPCLYEKKGNFEKVKEKEEKVLTESQAVSMCILHDLYGLSTDDIRYYSKLKARIQSESTDKLHFVFILKETTPEVVISTESIKFHVLLNDKGHLLNQAAEYLRADTEESAKNWNWIEFSAQNFLTDLDSITAILNHKGAFLWLLTKSFTEDANDVLDFSFHFQTTDVQFW